jgi:large subunit ribosomal protein L29
MLRADEIREMSDADLRARVAELEEERFRLGFRSATEPLEDPLRLRTIRHDIARLKTIARERELSGEPPATPAAPKAPAKKAGAKKATAKKRKAGAKKATAKKGTAKKGTAKKASARKASAKKSSATKAPRKAAKTATAKKGAAKKGARGAR